MVDYKGPSLVFLFDHFVSIVTQLEIVHAGIVVKLEDYGFRQTSALTCELNDAN